MSGAPDPSQDAAFAAGEPAPDEIWQGVQQDDAEYKKHMESFAVMSDRKRLAEERALAESRKRKREADEEAKKNPPKPKDAANPHVFVSGIPEEVTADELNEHFRKCGVIKVDPETGVPKIKMYKTPEGIFKGEALVTYYRQESVPLAVQMLDESEIRPGRKIRVEPAKFEARAAQADEASGEPAAKKKKKVRKIFDQTRDLAWDEGAARGSHLPTVVIIKNVFVAKDFEEQDFLENLREDLRPEMEAFGEVAELRIFDTNADGVISVKYRTHEGAKACFQRMNGRFFAGRQLQAEYWDGYSNYKVPESDELREARAKAYGDFLEGKTAAKPAKAAEEEELEDDE